MPLAPVEETMWKINPSAYPTQIPDSDINEKYESGEKRILTEINREKLPSFAQSLKTPGYMNLRPFYQRRSRWSPQMQSRLIESFLINIPIPPIILYETEYNAYEVMDGQQRITAIQAFYENKLELTGLEIWTKLNKFKYRDLPLTIRAGLDRRSISSIVIIRESTSDPEDALFLKQKTFERLNTGSVDLTQQEIRNCLYHGLFNSLLFKLARYPIFAEAWGIPTDDESLQLNSFYKKMEDVELVLRFFALRNVEYFRRGMRGFLDLYMMKSLNFSEKDIEILENDFIETINLAHAIYGKNLFKPFDLKTGDWKTKAYKNYYDAVMVGFSNHLNRKGDLIQRKADIIEQTKLLFAKNESRLLTGEGKTKAEIQERIKIFDDMLIQILGE
jgi:hypothetical protein